MGYYDIHDYVHTTGLDVSEYDYVSLHSLVLALYLDRVIRTARSG